MTKHRVKRKYWTKKEEEFLKNNYHKMSNSDIAILFGRADADQVQNKARKLGLTLGFKHKKFSDKQSPWNSEEDLYLRNWYGKVRSQNIADYLNRSVSSVYHRANRLGLKGKNKVKKKKSNIKIDYYRWVKIREGIIERDGGSCVICGYTTRLEVHHIHPVREGGSDRLENLITLCPNHHWEADAGTISRIDLKNLLK